MQRRRFPLPSRLGGATMGLAPIQSGFSPPPDLPDAKGGANMATQIDKAAQEATRADAHDRTPPAADANGQALATALDTRDRPQPTAEPATVAHAPEHVL